MLVITDGDIHSSHVEIIFEIIKSQTKYKFSFIWLLVIKFFFISLSLVRLSIFEIYLFLKMYIT